MVLTCVGFLNLKMVGELMKGKRKEPFDYIVIWSVSGIIVFFGFSALLVISTPLKWEELYTVFFSLVGSLAGGAMTLIGVRQTITAQRKQEEMKLIPEKIVALHQLNELSYDLVFYIIEKYDDFSEKGDADRRNLSSKPITQEEQANVRVILKNYMKDLKVIYEDISNREKDFIEKAAKIDIDVYKAVIQLFRFVKSKVFHLHLYPDSADLYLDNKPAEVYIEHLEKLISDVEDVKCEVCLEVSVFRKKVMIKKLEDYGQKQIM